MALTDPGTGKVVEFGVLQCKVTLARLCRAGDVLGVAADNFDDLGPAYSAAAAHSTAVTYLPRFVAGEDGAAGDVITAYGAAEIDGFTSCGVNQVKVYMAQTSALAGQVSATLPTGTASCGDVIGIVLGTTRVSLWPLFRGLIDTSTLA